MIPLKRWLLVFVTLLLAAPLPVIVVLGIGFGMELFEVAFAVYWFSMWVTLLPALILSSGLVVFATRSTRFAIWPDCAVGSAAGAVIGGASLWVSAYATGAFAALAEDPNVAALLTAACIGSGALSAACAGFVLVWLMNPGR